MENDDKLIINKGLGSNSQIILREEDKHFVEKNLKKKAINKKPF